MKALTLYQPWATLVAIGEKKIETRPWSTNYRGPLAIHAGKNREWEYLINETPFYKALSTHPTVWHMQPPSPWGCIVATCELVDIARITELQSFPACKAHWHQLHKWDLNKQERAFGDYSVGRFMWLLEDVKILAAPIPTKGAMGLWEWDEVKP